MVYLLHFNTRYKHAGHYLGSTCDLEARLALHAAGRGARLLHVVQAAGITWRLARTWPGGKAKERQLKKAARRQPLLSDLQGGTPCCTSPDIVTPATGRCGKGTNSCA